MQFYNIMLDTGTELEGEAGSDGERLLDLVDSDSKEPFTFTDGDGCVTRLIPEKVICVCLYDREKQPIGYRGAG